LNIVQHAIQLLQIEYQTRLSQDKFDKVVDLLENKSKVSAFIRLSSNARDCWIQRNSNIEEFIYIDTI
jgi:hypothetical protein